MCTACNKNDPPLKPVNEKVRGSIDASGYLQQADAWAVKLNVDSAMIYYSTALNLLERDKKWKAQFNVLLKIVDLYRLVGNTALSREKIEEADRLLSSRLDNDQLLLAELLHRKGLLLMDRGAFDSAVIAFEQSLSNRTAIHGPNDTALALTYNGLGTISFFRSDFPAALKYYNKAVELSKGKVHPQDADMSRFLQNIGIIYAQQGDYDKAGAAFGESMQILENISQPDDPDLANRYLNTGRFMLLIYKDKESLEYYDRAESILSKTVGPDHPDLGSLYQNKGQLFIHLADYEKALIYFKKALAIAENHFPAEHPNILQLYMNIGYVYEKKEDIKEALAYYEKSIPDNKDNPALVKTYSNMASLYTNLNKFDTANSYYEKAMQTALNLLGPDHPETGLLYTRYGYFLMKFGNAKKSKDLILKALVLSKKHFGLKSREVSNNFAYLGNYEMVANNNSAEALRLYQQALISYVADFNSEDYAENPNLDTIIPDRYLMNALNGKADALYSLAGNKGSPDITLLKLSLQTSKLATGVMERLRRSYQNEESKLIIASEERSTYQNTIKVAARLYELTHDKQYLQEAFTYADRGKSAVLLASVKDLQAIQVGNIPESIRKLEKSLKLSLGSYNRLIYEENQKDNPDQNKIRFWDGRTFELEARYDSLVGVLERDYPDYYTLKFSEPSIQLEQIQEQLEPGRSLIEYTVTDTLLYIFVINNKQFDLVTRKIGPAFLNNIRNITASTGSNDLMSIRKDDYLRYTQAAYALYRDLLLPVTAVSQDKKLIIVPDSEIGYLSFDMLLNAPADTTSMDFRKLSFLIKDYVISYSTSATLQFSMLEKKDKRAARNLLALAPDYNNLTDLNKNGFTDESGNTVYLMPIPGVEEEIKGIRKAIGGKTLMGPRATERAFKKEASRYNILHFAMHTLINNEEPMLSKLVFYQDNDSIEDGMLNTYELFGMNLNARLAVLSACNTGSGRLIEGEGIMNLARGFIYAGVPSIVMTLWSVEDQTSATIVKKFYRYLDNGEPKDEALRKAKLDLLDEGDMLHAHPYYWAAYVSIGDYSPMPSSKPFWLKLFFGLVGLVAIIGIASVLKQRKKHTQVL
jgi:CHAT domain-containing protein/Tfp pilus assembly protein PilF